MIKQITLSDHTHDIGAKYDGGGNEIVSTYISRTQTQGVVVKNLTLTDGTTGTTVTYKLVCVDD